MVPHPLEVPKPATSSALIAYVIIAKKRQTTQDRNTKEE